MGSFKDPLKPLMGSFKDPLKPLMGSFKDPLKSLERHDSAVPRGLRGALNWAPIMTKGVSLLDGR